MNPQRVLESLPTAATADEPGAAALSPPEGTPDSPLVAKSALVDAAYDEYCRLRLAGEAVDPDEFCSRYPRYQSSLRRVLAGVRWFEDNSYVLTERKPVEWPAAGATVLGFHLLYELGRGTFARVFLASELALGGRRVVVKFSRQGAVEADTLGRLNHPNVVPVHSVQEDPVSGLTAVCMPYLGSATLDDVLDYVYAERGGCRWAATILRAARVAGDAGLPAAAVPAALRHGTYTDGVLHLAIQLVDALAGVHGRGVCHGDMKPSNVLLTPEGRPMLLDFNLSVGHQVGGEWVGGSVPYLSPEQAAAVLTPEGTPPPPIDGRADLYSLGVILYELLSGRQPFGVIPLKLERKERMELLRQRQRQGFRPLREANPRVDKGLAQVVEKCLAYDRADRPQTAAELAAALRKHLTGAKRLRRWLLVAATVALALLGGVAGYSLVVPAEPYSDYHLRLGEAALRQGNPAEAIPHFDKAIEARPDLAPAYFLRGRAYQKQDDMVAALENYRKADELAPDGKVKACWGYCYNWTANDQTAAERYLQAIALGYAPAAVFNNLGYSYLQVGEVDEAQKYLELALQQDQRLRAAHFNLALVEGYRASNGQGKYLPDVGIKHIETALRLGPPAGDLHAYAAYLYALTQPEPAKTATALDHMEKAFALGWGPKQLQFLSQFEALAKEPRFHALLKRPVAPIPAVSTPKLLDPVQDASTQ